MESRKKFLKDQHSILKKHDLTYCSVNIQLSWSEIEKKLKKNLSGMVPYKDINVITKVDLQKNGTVILLGKRYGGLIGVDVDNKNDTVDFFETHALENDFDLNTLSVKTINKGVHYYFRLTKDQMKGLANFMSSTALCFSTPTQPRNIDIKYTNQLFFGPSYLTYDDDTHKYEIVVDKDPVTLPDYLYAEILRTYNNQNNSNITKNVTTTINKKKQTVTLTVDKEKEARLRIYLDCIINKTFDMRDTWLSIGAVIYNECKSFELFEEYSKKSSKYDKQGCIDVWNSYTDNRDKKATIKKLIELAEVDARGRDGVLLSAIIKDRIGILEFIFQYGSSDVYMTYLFYNLNPSKYMYDSSNKIWYCINKFGIYIKDPNGEEIKSAMNDCLRSVLKDYYLKSLSNITNTEDDDVNSKKVLKATYLSIIKYCTKSQNKDNMIGELKLLCRVERLYEKMDTINPSLVGFSNGVWDLENNTFRNAKPEEFVSVTTGYKYIKADPKLKEKAMILLRSIFSNKEELMYVLKHISLGLYGSNPEEKFYIWIGTGSNGKGILRDIIQVVLGDYYDSMDISYFYKNANSNNKSNTANPVMVRKKDCRFVITTEPEGDTPLQSSILKTISGNDPLQVRGLYQESFNYIPKYKLVIQTNNEPVFAGFDSGMKRRPILINFPHKFVDKPKLSHEKKIDKTLKKHIITNKLYRNEFFDILVDNYMLYEKNGLDMPLRFEQDTKVFIKNNYPFSEWFDSNITKTNNPKDMVKSSQLYDNFEEFMGSDVRGITPLLLKNMLKTNGIEDRRKRTGIYYLRIKLNIVNEFDDDND